jgi:hypothetical protein
MRSYALAMILGLLGCASDHGMDRDGSTPADFDAWSSTLDVGPPGDLDGGPSTFDSGPVTYDTGPLPLRDAGIHTLGDAGTVTHDGAGEVWVGYLEAYTFASGSDAVRIVFDADTGSGTRTGVVILGDAAPPSLPPATNPNVGYPEGMSIPQLQQMTRLFEGQPYAFDDGVVSSSRMQLGANTAFVWARWCALQYPVSLGGTSYACMPSTAASTGEICTYRDPNSGETVQVDCGRQYLCGVGTGVCRCDAASCWEPTNHVLTFDVHVTGNQATGTALGHTVYLTRQP